MKQARSSGLATGIVLAMIVGMMMGGECFAKGPAYPTRPIRLVVPFPPGGPVDLTGRAYAEALKTILPQPIEVVNKPGGGGMTGTVDAITSKPDGYTVVINTSVTVAGTPQLQPGSPLRGPEDVQPIITAFIVANVF